MKLIAEKVYHKFSDVHKLMWEQSNDSAILWQLICLNSLGLQLPHFFYKSQSFLVKLRCTIFENIYTPKT